MPSKVVFNSQTTGVFIPLATNPLLNITALQRLLAEREHHAFLDELLLALEDVLPSQLDYLQVLGGDGLHILLQDQPQPALLSAYAQLLLSGKIRASSEVIMSLHEKFPSEGLRALAQTSTRPVCYRNKASGVNTSPEQPTIQLKRVIQIIDMGLGTFTASDALGVRRSVFRSEQERTFLQALALRFPGLHAFPNYPLDQLADFDILANLLDDETIEYGRRCRIDAVLVVPGEGDPVAAFELDSRMHDEPTTARRDRLKNRLFRVIQIPFFRLRAEQCTSIGVDEWYALLTDEVAGKIDCGHRIRIRNNHPNLIPI